MIALQRCRSCGRAQYPAREFCGTCLSDELDAPERPSAPGRVLARTRLHHSNEPRFRGFLPLGLALVQFDAGPVALCFLPGRRAAGDAVEISTGPDGCLEGM